MNQIIVFHYSVSFNLRTESIMVNPVTHEFLHIYHWKTMATIVALLAIVCGALLLYLT